LLLLSSCKSLVPAKDSYISQEKAIDLALEIASSSAPEISGPQETPSNLRTERMTLDEAIKQIHPNEEVSGYGADPAMMVWLITMDGLWLGEMTAPDSTPASNSGTYHHYAIILDAKTGSEISSTLSP